MAGTSSHYYRLNDKQENQGGIDGRNVDFLDGLPQASPGNVSRGFIPSPLSTPRIPLEEEANGRGYIQDKHQQVVDTRPVPGDISIKRGGNGGTWQPSAMMLGLITLGTVVAVAHHFTYRYLDRKPVTVFPEQWARNIAAAAAFVVKTCFTIATGIAFTEVLWWSLRKRLTKIGSLDKLFTVQSNPLSFFSADGVKTAPLAMALAAIAWIIPLVAILTPNTLGVSVLETTKASPCKVPTFAGGDSSKAFYEAGPDRKGPYDGPSQEIRKATAKVIPTGELLPYKSPCGANCTYTIDFFAPALKCEDQENPSDVVGDGKSWTYYDAEVATVEETPLTLLVSYNNYYASNMSVVKDTPNEKLFRTLLCTAHNATYHLNATYTNDEPQYASSITKYHDHIPVIRDAHRFRLNCAGQECARVNFYALTSAVLAYLSGSLQKVDVEGTLDSSTQVQNTTLVSFSDEWEVAHDLLPGIPALLSNLILSTLSLPSAARADAQCTARTVFPAYTYTSLWLVLPYAIALVLVLLALALGTIALQATGLRVGDPFSQLLVTTRNPALDELAAGCSSLSSKDGRWLKAQRVRLGELRTSDTSKAASVEVGTGHAAFGIAGQTLTLKKGVVYD